MLGDATLPSVTSLDLQAIDEVDYVLEAASGDGQMGLPVPLPRSRAAF